MAHLLHGAPHVGPALRAALRTLAAAASMPTALPAPPRPVSLHWAQALWLAHLLPSVQGQGLAAGTAELPLLSFSAHTQWALIQPHELVQQSGSPTMAAIHLCRLCYVSATAKSTQC